MTQCVRAIFFYFCDILEAKYRGSKGENAHSNEICLVARSQNNALRFPYSIYTTEDEHDVRSTGK